MNRTVLNNSLWLLIVVMFGLYSCHKEPVVPQDPKQPEQPESPTKKVDPSRDPHIVDQEETLLKLLGKKPGVAFASTMKVGDTISIGLWAEGELQIEGLEPSGYPSRHPDEKEWICYTVTAPTVVIKGDVRSVKLAAMPIKAIVTSQAPRLEGVSLLTCPMLSELDLSSNEHCRWLEARNLSQLSWIALPRTPSFKSLDLSSNPSLKQVDLSGCTMLENLTLANTAIQKLDLTHSKELRVLYLSHTPCPIPDLKQLKTLEDLWLDQKGVAYLDVAHLPESLRSLNVRYNRLSGILDLSHLKNLEVLSCNNNQLIGLKLDHLPTQLFAEDNQLMQIELLKAENQDYIKCSQELESLPCLSIYNNRLSSSAISQFVSKLFAIDSSQEPSWGMAIVASRSSVAESYSFAGNEFSSQHLDDMVQKGWQLWGITTSSHGGGSMDPITY